MSYSPVPDSVRTYHDAIIQSLIYLEEHAPRSVDETCEWLAFVQDILGQYLKTQPRPNEFTCIVNLLSRAFAEQSGLEYPHCLDMVTGRLELR